ncbi:MAG TPA: MarR family transcriptional regulator [Pseudolysinimonas sp.]|jgi:DNA-binding MarR family transcriptional regulator
MRRAEKLRWLILAAQREGNRMLAAALRPLGLTPAQSEVLRLLGDHEPLTLTGLGELLVCESGTNPSRLVDRVVALGLVDRTTPDAGDRRQVILRLTAKGRELEAAVRAIEEAMYAELDGVGTDAEVATVIALLERVVAGRPAGDAIAARVAREGKSSGAGPITSD